MGGYIYFWSRISPFRGLQELITAPAQPHVTEIAMYTALLYKTKIIGEQIQCF